MGTNRLQSTDDVATEVPPEEALFWRGEEAAFLRGDFGRMATCGSPREGTFSLAALAISSWPENGLNALARLDSASKVVVVSFML